MTKIDKIDLDNISLIKKYFKNKNINSIKIKKGEYEIEVSTTIEHSLPTTPSVSNTNENKEQKDNKNDKEKVKQENIVKSPMVGVAYLSADPESEKYTKVGQHVKQGDTLLLIEAMKTFNEIKAPKSGIVKEIIILNSQPVEFGDDLIIFE